MNSEANKIESLISSEWYEFIEDLKKLWQTFDKATPHIQAMMAKYPTWGGVWIESSPEGEGKTIITINNLPESNEKAETA